MQRQHLLRCRDLPGTHADLHLQDAPINVADYPAVERQAELGFLAITLQRRDLQPPQLEQSLRGIVFFADMLQRRLAYCRLLVRHEVGAKLRQLQAELAYDEGAG